MRNIIPASTVSSLLAALVMSGVASTTPALAASPRTARVSITDLGVPGGFTTSSATGLNDRGDVAGSIAAGDFGASHAALWRDGAWHDLGNGSAAAISHDRHIVGYSGSGSDQQAANWTAGGRLSALANLPNGFWSQATSTNARGQVVGYGQGSTTRAIIWNPGAAPRELTTHGTGSSYAFDINDAGQVVGSDGDQAVLWDDNGHERTLGAGASSVAYSINSHEVVVGDANGHAFTWTKNAGVRDLALPSGSGTSNAVSISDDGSIVGSAQVPSSGLPVFHAVLWQNNRFCDLNSMLPSGSGWELATATAINNHGQILGNGTHNGQDHPFLMTVHGSAC